MSEGPPKILHVDDREENRYIVAKILRNAGFEVITGTTGREALELAAKHPDLIILDVRLPDMMGYEVSRRIKSNPATNSIPIIQLSASFVTNESKVQALDSGADQYLTQPVEPPVLIASVKALLRLGKAEAISRLSARQWQTTFDALSEGIGLLDSQHNVLRCNRAMSELLHISYGKIEGQNVRAIFDSVFGERLTRELQTFTHRQVHEAKGARGWYRITIDPVTNENNEFVGSILVIADTSAQRQAEEALKVTERLAATGRLAHSIAHEINNPLEAVTNLIYLLKGLLKEHSEATEFLNIADIELGRVSRITKQTLSFHRDSAEPVKTCLSELVNSVLVLFGQQLKEKQISVDTRFEEKNAIEAFPGQLRQVFANFLSNAIDACGANARIVVHVFDSKAWRHGERGVRVVFCDTGRGIPDAAKQKIFEAFFTTKEQKGSGLGLWLSAGIVNQHRGSIKLRSRVQPPSGTCFSLFFPITHKAVTRAGDGEMAERDHLQERRRA